MNETLLDVAKLHDELYESCLFLRSVRRRKKDNSVSMTFRIQDESYKSSHLKVRISHVDSMSFNSQFEVLQNFFSRKYAYLIVTNVYLIRSYTEELNQTIVIQGIDHVGTSYAHGDVWGYWDIRIKIIELFCPNIERIPLSKGPKK